MSYQAKDWVLIIPTAHLQPSPTPVLRVELRKCLLDPFIHQFQELWVRMMCPRGLAWKTGEMMIPLMEKGKLGKDLVLGVPDNLDLVDVLRW